MITLPVFPNFIKKINRGLVDSFYPIQKGNIIDFDKMEKIWHHTIENELRMETEEINVLMTEKPLNSQQNRKKMCKIMFEKFNVHKFYPICDAILTLYREVGHKSLALCSLY